MAGSQSTQHPLLVANSNDLDLLGNQEREPVDVIA